MDRAQAMREAAIGVDPLLYQSPTSERVATAGADAERARIVAWLRGEIKTAYTDPQYDIGINLADAIERGEPWREE